MMKISTILDSKRLLVYPDSVTVVLYAALKVKNPETMTSGRRLTIEEGSDDQDKQHGRKSPYQGGTEPPPPCRLFEIRTPFIQWSLLFPMAAWSIFSWAAS